MSHKVFIPQIVRRFDGTAGELVPAFDLSPAAKFGSLTLILDQDDDTKYLSNLTGKISKELEEFKHGDYLLAVGDPSLIAVCAGIILRKFHSMKMLKWDRQLKTYIEMEINP